MTAFTLTVTLSLVMTSCGGTSIVTVRRLTRTSLSMKGMMTTTPGPFPPMSPLANRPQRKITPRSYSRSTLNPIRTNTTATNRTANGLTRESISNLFLLGGGLHMYTQSIHGGDLGLVARLERLLAERPPEFAMDG